jgi:sigma-B regulation protein RsbU (phosphoserine phosphatase)
MIGDVAGKGVPASLFMAMAVSSFKFYAMPDVQPEETLWNLNVKLKQESSSNLFVTMFYSVFDLKKNVMLYASGGHNPLLYLTEGKPPSFLDVENGFPLGVLKGPYSGNRVRFKKGDLFVFYTDGITEAVNKKSQMYGQHRLAALAQRYKDCSAREILDRLESDVGRFEPRNKQHDDMTAIVVKII